MYGSTINPASQTTTLDALHLTLCYEPRHQLCSQDFSSSQFLLEALSVSSLLLQISLLEVNAKTKMWVLFFGENPNQISKEVERGQEGTGTNKAWISKHVSIETNWRWFKKKEKKQTNQEPFHGSLSTFKYRSNASPRHMQASQSATASIPFHIQCRMPMVGRSPDAGDHVQVPL